MTANSPRAEARPARKAPKFDPRTQRFRMCGVDLTRIDGIDLIVALAVVSEVGADLSRFPSDKHFASWMGCVRAPGSPAARCSPARPGAAPTRRQSLSDFARRELDRASGQAYKEAVY